jgi:hypothetical protein
MTNLTRRSFDNPTVVTDHEEGVKIASYRATEWGKRGILVPFAITSTGKIGTLGMHALSTIKDLYELGDSFLSSIIRTISSICHTYTARMNIAGRQSLRSITPALATVAEADVASNDDSVLAVQMDIDAG